MERVLSRAPLAVIEILSPEDRVLRYNERLADYRLMGIRHIWVIDLANKMGYDCSTTAWLPVDEFRVRESPIFLRLADLWNELETSQ
jgi:Uma2 family endonuclease